MRKQYIVWTSVLIFYSSVTFNQNLSAYTYHPFSVSDSTVVYFSPGNLQFNAMLDSHRCADGKIKKGTWRFAEHQWDYVANNINSALCNSITDDELGWCTHGTVYYNGIECENTKQSEFYEGWIDVFAWATSGYDNTANDPFAIHFEPWEKKGDYTALSCVGFGPSADTSYHGYYRNLEGANLFYDWGQYNDIVNGSKIDSAGTWRLLTGEEFEFLMTRQERHDRLLPIRGRIITKQGIKIYGLILLPDGWDFSKARDIGIRSSHIDQYSFYYDIISYTETEWQSMESMGAIFLTANLFEKETDDMRYWSSTFDNDNDILSIFAMALIYKMKDGPEGFMVLTFCRSEMGCVRLVRDVSLRTIYHTICQGDSFIWNGKSYKTAGTYSQTFTSTLGKDSIVTCHLSVLPTVFTDTIVTICENNAPFAWQNYACTRSGEYRDTLVSAFGCDSVVTLHLTVLPAYAQTDTATLCYGSQYVWHGKQYTQPGLYADTLQTVSGCDSLCSILLTPAQVYLNTIYDTISKGQTYLWNNKTLSQPGLYVYNLPSQTNCDSIITLSLYVKTNSHHTATDNITTNNNKTKIEPTTVYAGQDFIVTTPHALVVQIYNATGQLVQLKQVNEENMLAQVQTLPDCILSNSQPLPLHP